MVQKRMTRSLILLRSRCTHRGARTHILAIIPEIHRCVLELLSEKKSNCVMEARGILKSQFSNFMLRVSFPLLLPNMKVYQSLQKIELSYIFLMLFFASARFCQFFILQSYFGWQSVKIEVEKNMTISSVMHRVNQLLVLQIFLSVRKDH